MSSINKDEGNLFVGNPDLLNDISDFCFGGQVKRVNIKTPLSQCSKEFNGHLHCMPYPKYHRGFSKTTPLNLWRWKLHYFLRERRLHNDNELYKMTI
jgi:hypothetical protein